MKKIYFFLFCTLILVNSCSKSSEDNVDENPGCPLSGFGISYAYRFWTSIPMYNTKVEVKDINGAIVQSGSNVIDGYYQLNGLDNFEPEPCKYSASTEAVFQLLRGRSYTYTATNEAQVFTGKIDVPCRGETNCYNVRIK
jgi:hypothetical protein